MKVKLENVNKDFSEIALFKNINLEMESGKIYAFIGKNGSGKSVLFKMICGFYEPTNGKIFVDGIDIIKEKIFSPNTRALIEKPNFLPDLTGLQNLELLASIQSKITKNDIIESLKVVNLYEDMNKKYHKYSLGMKQKLGIAQVIMENPQIMIIDEPFNGIEEETAKKIRKYFIEKKKEDKLILIASHIKDDIDTMADIIYKIDGTNIFELEKI